MEKHNNVSNPSGTVFVCKQYYVGCFDVPQTYWNICVINNTVLHAVYIFIII